MKTTDIGQNAESIVALHLEKLGHKIIDKNWKTRQCEIDIISKYKKTIFFCEVKYRSSDAWGDGFSYITKTKLKQMHFAAENWINSCSWSGDAQLIAASVDSNFDVKIVEI